MKKLILILLISTVPMFGQQQNNTISVIGECSKKVDIEKYIINVEFREVMADGYQNIESKSISQLKEDYKNKLNTIGVDFEKFKENVLYKITSTGYGAQAYYFYVTKSLDEVKKIHAQKMKGVTITWVDVIAKEKTNEEMMVLNKKAIQDARGKATRIAGSINKKVGSIQSIKDTNYKQQYYNVNKSQELQKHYITVTFVLE
ncbi:hypothetical protein IWQ47_004514 [Aquimarina sp. EL_43]|uniref:SIMPL domain-containing protein n=1 Tax=unclassified Aquimarina TaxID=2627091 RepID=UPI0018C8FAAE|nr:MULTISPECIES: SIMPL domain-containing protein [unclassified Aquimarina]MBG6133152.1 hypothetical protein [Aquimarina sp. EL_35]MBG6153310.1 hypothetical protein [Aquimarina sp. EL_32]MBG6171421.1 hypothetical protein [Aquimarina sp. EL_43]